MLGDKVKEKIKVKEGVVEEFEKHYKQMCNPLYQRKKNRNVSVESPFDSNNVPPSQYLIDDYKLPVNPNKMRPDEIDFKNVGLAGRVSQIGKLILELGSKKAQYITTISLRQDDEVPPTPQFNNKMGK